jgi:type IX secretion system PorP/SprF family membrane protein
MNKLAIACIGLLICRNLFAQDPQFSQYYANPIYTNPAFAGSSGNIRMVMAARSQYVALQNNYRTASASIDANISALNGGVGLIAMTDVAGDGFLTNTTISGVYSYYVPVSRKVSVRAALQGGIVQKSYDFSRFRFGDQIDDRMGFTKPTAESKGLEQVIFPNFSTGFLIYSKQIYGGFAAHNLTEPNQSFYSQNSSDVLYKLPRRYTAHVGANIYITKERYEEQRTYISPNILFMQQRNFNQLNLGLFLKRQHLNVGAWFRQTSNNTDAVIALIGLKYSRFRVGYSFDATLSGARTATIGSHEITLAVEIKNPKKSQGKRQVKSIKCPEF